jgi:hypothetical protein
VLSGSPAQPFVLVWDKASNTTSVVSVDSAGKPVAGWQPSISADGRYVAYTQWAPPDTTPPVLSNLTANPTHVGGCGGPTSSTISVTATDPDDPVASVTLTYAPTGGTSQSAPMKAVGGDVWQAAITIQSSWSTGQITYSVQGRDSHGNRSAPLSPTSGEALTLDSCIQ